MAYLSNIPGEVWRRSRAILGVGGNVDKESSRPRGKQLKGLEVRGSLAHLQNGSSLLVEATGGSHARECGPSYSMPRPREMEAVWVTGCASGNYWNLSSTG